MNSKIKEIYYGDNIPSEECPWFDNEYSQLQQSLEVEERRFIEELDSVLKLKLLDLLSKIEDLEEIKLRESFISGFKLGARIANEINMD